MRRIPAPLALTPALSQRKREQNRRHGQSTQNRSGFQKNRVKTASRAYGYCARRYQKMCICASPAGTKEHAMSGPVLHLGATVLCSHGGQATPSAPVPRSPKSPSPFAANMAATRNPSPSASVPGWTMSPARRSGCRWRVLLQRRNRFATDAGKLPDSGPLPREARRCCRREMA